MKIRRLINNLAQLFQKEKAYCTFNDLDLYNISKPLKASIRLDLYKYAENILEKILAGDYLGVPAPTSGLCSIAYYYIMNELEKTNRDLKPSYEARLAIYSRITTLLPELEKYDPNKNPSIDNPSYKRQYTCYWFANDFERLKAIRGILKDRYIL